MEAPAGGVDDMTKLSYLHEPGVLQNLKIRYELNEIYVTLAITIQWSSFHYVIYSFYYCKHILMIDIITDLHWKYSYCNQPIPKTASYL